MPDRPVVSSSPAAGGANRWLLLLGLLSAFAQGCQKAAPTGDVSGNVTVAGAAVQFGTIAFLPKVGRPIAVNIENGAYRAAAVPVGPTQVTVQAVKLAQPVGHPTLGPALPLTAKGKFVPVPSRYAMPKTSGLQYEVAAGAQTKDFDLEGEK